MSANERQIGGDHYKMEYQHWDFITDTAAPYLIGCASKYLTRWRGKNGLEDLNKCLHYIDKAIERGIGPVPVGPTAVEKFVSQLPGREAAAVRCLFDGNLYMAKDNVHSLIEEATQSAA